MTRLIFAALSGALFGLGLLVSGMTDTRKVQGWLDIFGAWDPTLAFVLGGAIIPMAVAWRIAARRRQAVLGGDITPLPATEITPSLITGSMMFGAGWGLAGLCPGPAMASLGWGGSQGLLFVAAMAAGMFVTPHIRNLTSRSRRAPA